MSGTVYHHLPRRTRLSLSLQVVALRSVTTQTLGAGKARPEKSQAQANTESPRASPTRRQALAGPAQPTRSVQSQRPPPQMPPCMWQFVRGLRQIQIACSRAARFDGMPCIGTGPLARDDHASLAGQSQ